MATKGERTRKLIIEKASEIFNVRGIEGTSMSDVMQATKLSKGSLYVHFENKQDLVNAAVDYKLSNQLSRIYQSVNLYNSPDRQLTVFIDYFLNPLDPDSAAGGCPMMNFGTEADDTNPAVKIKIDHAVTHMHRVIVEIIQRGIKENVFKKDWNYIEFSTIAFAMIEGGIVICRVLGSNDKMLLINNYLREIVRQNML